MYRSQFVLVRPEAVSSLQCILVRAMSRTPFTIIIVTGRSYIVVRSLSSSGLGKVLRLVVYPRVGEKVILAI